MSEALIAKLIEAGTPAALVAEVAMQLARAQVATEILEQRRAKDRERKRDIPRKSEESSESVEIQETPAPKVSPAPLPNHNPSPPAPKGASPQKNGHDPTTDHPVTAEEIVEAWNERMVPRGFPAVRRLTPHRQRQIKARLRESKLEDWQRAFDALERSAFCRGENDRGWRADFDFLLQPKSFTKLIEGAYDH